MQIPEQCIPSLRKAHLDFAAVLLPTQPIHEPVGLKSVHESCDGAGGEPCAVREIHGPHWPMVFNGTQNAHLSHRDVGSLDADPVAEDPIEAAQLVDQCADPFRTLDALPPLSYGRELFEGERYVITCTRDAATSGAFPPRHGPRSFPDGTLSDRKRRILGELVEFHLRNQSEEVDPCLVR